MYQDNNFNSNGQQLTSKKDNNNGIMIFMVILIIGLIFAILYFGFFRDSKTNSNNVDNTNVDKTVLNVEKFEAKVYILKPEEGGRQTPIFEGYKPMFNFGEDDIRGSVTFNDNIELVMPGDTVIFMVTLTAGESMNVGTEFSIREGGRVIGRGKVTKIY